MPRKGHMLNVLREVDFINQYFAPAFFMHMAISAQSVDYTILNFLTLRTLFRMDNQMATL